MRADFCGSGLGYVKYHLGLNDSCTGLYDNRREVYKLHLRSCLLTQQLTKLSSVSRISRRDCECSFLLSFCASENFQNQMRCLAVCNFVCLSTCWQDPAYTMECIKFLQLCQLLASASLINFCISENTLTNYVYVLSCCCLCWKFWASASMAFSKPLLQYARMQPEIVAMSN